MAGGYTGKLLYGGPDLRRASGRTTGHMAWRATIIGGRGLGGPLLWDLLPAGADPLADESPLMFLPGPLTGLMPGGAHTAVMFKSPGTGITLGHAIIGAQWGTELKNAGYDGLVVTGKAPQAGLPAHRRCKADSLHDAGDLWGRGTMSTELALKETLGDTRGA